MFYRHKRRNFSSAKQSSKRTNKPQDELSTKQYCYTHWANIKKAFKLFSKSFVSHYEVWWRRLKFKQCKRKAKIFSLFFLELHSKLFSLALFTALYCFHRRVQNFTINFFKYFSSFYFYFLMRSEVFSFHCSTWGFDVAHMNLGSQTQMSFSLFFGSACHRRHEFNLYGGKMLLHKIWALGMTN